MSIESRASDLDDSVLLRVAGSHAGAAKSQPLPALGSVLDGEYELESFVGRGGMGCVFAGRHVLTGRRVAIKWMLRRDGAEQLAKRFLREARVARRIRHPNVVEIHDAVSHAEATYLVLELLDGETLREQLLREPLKPADATRIVLDVLEALREAHRQGVIHRDLKPENIFRCRDSGTTKLLDFGISVSREPRAPESQLTQTGCFIGTAAYTALERLRENQPFDHRVDLYAVGVVLYEALTGALPFSGKTPSELTYQLATSLPQPLRELRPDLPESLERIVAKALAREPHQRFADAEDFIAALRPVSAALEEQGPRDEPMPARETESRDDARLGRVKGILLVRLRDYAIRHHGSRAWQDVLDRLSPEDREELSSLLLVGGWYPVGLWNRTLNAYLNTNFSNPGLGMTDFGRYVAAQDLTTLFKLVLGMSSPDMVVARTASLYNRYFDSGTWTPHKTGPGSWRCVLDAPSGANSGPGDLSCAEGITAWVRRALELTGTKATVEKTGCRFRGSRTCVYEIRWQEDGASRSTVSRIFDRVTGKALLAGDGN